MYTSSLDFALGEKFCSLLVCPISSITPRIHAANARQGSAYPIARNSCAYTRVSYSTNSPLIRTSILPLLSKYIP
jgi:hypothetical protein